MVVTLTEYLALEWPSETKHEFVDGKIRGMGPVSIEQSLICSNVLVALGDQLREGPWRVYTSNLRIHGRATALVTYAGVTVVRGKPERDLEDEGGIHNPVVLFEVRFREDVFAQYRHIPSLREYLFASGEERRVDHCRRNDDGSWTRREARGEGAVELASIGCRLTLDEVYRDVFEEPAQ
jgi:Uma2 family endonuclease